MWTHALECFHCQKTKIVLYIMIMLRLFVKLKFLRLPVLSILSVVPLCIPFLLQFEILFMIFDMI